MRKEFLLRTDGIARYCLAGCLAIFGLTAAEHHGSVKFGGLPLPGASVTATQGDKKFIALTDERGAYSFAELPDGTWTVQVEMLCFSPLKKDVTVASDAAAAEWNLQLLPLDEIKAAAGPVAPPPVMQQEAPAVTALTSPKPDKKAPDKKAKAQRNQPAAAPQSGFRRTDLNATGDAAK